MRKNNKKALVGALLCGCGIIAVSGISHISETAEAIPVSLTEVSRETPTIILDAGHGESI